MTVATRHPTTTRTVAHTGGQLNDLRSRLVGRLLTPDGAAY